MAYVGAVCTSRPSVSADLTVREAVAVDSALLPVPGMTLVGWSHLKGEPQLRERLHQAGLWNSLWGIFWIGDGQGSPQLTVGSVLPGRVVQGGTEKSVEL